MFMFLVMMLVGVWAIKDNNLKLGGSILFSTTGITAEISQGVLEGGTFKNSADESTKFKKIIINANKTTNEIEKEFKSWHNINLLFNEEGEDVTVTFTITNKSKTATEILNVLVSVSASKMTNATATLNTYSAFLKANGDSQEFVITFSINDKRKDASLVGFEIAFEMFYDAPFAVKADGTSADFDFTLGNDGTAVLAKCNSTSATTLVIPAAIQTSDGAIYKVTSIADGESSSGMFYSTRSKLQSVSLPATLTNIGDYAFEGCYRLRSIEIPSSVTSIGDYAFSGCGLPSVEIPDSVTRIGDGAFSASSLESIEIPSSVIEIGNEAFSYCVSLASIEIPKGVTIIGNGAFWGCEGLTNIKIPEGVTIIIDVAFGGCIELTSIEIPSSVIEIGNGAFMECSSLATVIIDSETVAGDAIYLERLLANSATTTVYVKNNSDGSEMYVDYYLTDNFTKASTSNKTGYAMYTRYLVTADGVGTDYTFSLNSQTMQASLTKCTNASLVNTVLPSEIRIEGTSTIYTVTSIGMDAFLNCTILKTIEIPSSVASIGSGAFEGCSSLASIKIPAGVTSIATGTFATCTSLKEIYIPLSVVSVGMRGFQGCTALSDVYYEGSSSQWSKITIEQPDSNRALTGATIHYNSY